MQESKRKFGRHNLDLDQVEKLLEEDTNSEIRGISFAHVLGNPPDMDRLMALVKKYNLVSFLKRGVQVARLFQP